MGKSDKRHHSMTLAEFKQKHGFEPKYTFSQLKQHLPGQFKSQKIEDSGLYKTVGSLTAQAYPTEKGRYDKRWTAFYLPLKRRQYFILVPMTIILYEKKFFLHFMDSEIEVSKGKEKDEFYRGLMAQTLEFTGILKENPRIVTRAIPYDIRTGRVLGKYVMEKPLLLEETKEEVLRLYEDHVKRDEKSGGISLNDYLDTAALCYQAAYGGVVKGLTPEQMYRRLADGRDCGMLELEDNKSEKVFGSWARFSSGCGGHPFEIIFSMHGHGIDLFPPGLYEDRSYYVLRVTNYAYATPFIEMVKALIRNRVPFRAHRLEEVLDYMSGDSYFGVNTHAEHGISYFSEYRKILKHIEWDEPEMVRWKPTQELKSAVKKRKLSILRKERK